MTRVLFVCTGNTCRSPMAEALLKKEGKSFEVMSAGIQAMPGSGAAAHARVIAREKGQSMDHHQARRVDDELLKWADVVLTMTRAHRDLLRSSFPTFTDQIFTLSEYAGEQGDIADPIGGELRDYRVAAEQMEELLEKIKHKLG